MNNYRYITIHPSPLRTVMLVHASLRMRNLKNKVANKIESIGITKSPMGLLLSTLGKEDN